MTALCVLPALLPACGHADELAELRTRQLELQRKLEPAELFADVQWGIYYRARSRGDANAEELHEEWRTKNADVYRLEDALRSVEGRIAALGEKP
jgi:hypothetical protein